MLDGIVASASLIDWTSHKLKRRCRSSLAGELQACADGLDRIIFAVTLWSWLISPSRCDQQSLNNWVGAAVVDHKGLYDLMPGITTTLEEKRSQLEADTVRDTIEQWNLNVRWVAGPYQLADSLTKFPDKANEALSDLLRSRSWILVHDPDIMAGRRLEEKQRHAAPQVE